MPERYLIAFAPGGLAYVRQLLGTRPYDEVGALILNIEQQKGEQDRPAVAPPFTEEPPTDAAPSDEPGLP